MVIHDEKGDVGEKIKQIAGCGYNLLGYFILDEDTWWAEYFAPLEKLISQTRTEYANDLAVLELVRNAQGEVDMFRSNPEMNSSVCFVMSRKGYP